MFSKTVFLISKHHRTKQSQKSELLLVVGGFLGSGDVGLLADVNFWKNYAERSDNPHTRVYDDCFYVTDAS